MFPGKNFVDGDTGQTYNFVHTSCGDVPWVQVDLGSMKEIYRVIVYNRVDCCQSRILGTRLQIINDQNEMVYVSDPVNSTNQTYSWYPPNSSIKVDEPDESLSFNLTIRDTPGTWSWADSMAQAKAAGARLPTHDEVRKYIASRGQQPLYGKDVWWPVSDGSNVWVSVGNYDVRTRLGNRHDSMFGPPGWGPTNQYQPFRTSIGFIVPA